MGLAASSGRDNDDLVDKLVEANIIVTHRVETVLRLVDRGRFFPEEGRDIAYKDLAWKSDFGSPGRIHISAPCIYANVLEYLDLQKGNSFLNVGSGTGYLSTVAGYLIGSTGTNHGIEIHSNIIEYARGLVTETLHRQETQCYDWAVPEFTCGNGLFLSPAHYGKYDRVYCGAAVPGTHRRILWELLKIGGILVMPFDDQLQQVRRKASDMFEVKIITSVSFSDFILPTEEETSKALYSSAPPFSPLPTLQYLCASFIRKTVRTAVAQTHKIHIRDLVSKQPKRANETHPVFEFRDGEQPPVDEALRENRNQRLRQIFAIVRPDLEPGNFEANEEFDNDNNNHNNHDNDNDDDNDDDDDEGAEERRRLAREPYRLEWFRQRLRAHIANRAARRAAALWSEITFRRRLREAQARLQQEVNAELEDVNRNQNDDIDIAGQDDNSESSGSGSLSTTASTNHSVISPDTSNATTGSAAAENSDGSSGTGRTKKRSLLEQESENSLSAKRRNSDDANSSAAEELSTTAMEISQFTDGDGTAENIDVQHFSEEIITDEKKTIQNETNQEKITLAENTKNDTVDEEPMETVEEVGKFAETLSDQIIEQSQTLLEKDSAQIKEVKILNNSGGGASVKQNDGGGECAEEPEPKRPSSSTCLSIPVADTNKLDEEITGLTSKVNNPAGTEIGHDEKARSAVDDPEELMWHNNELYKSKVETDQGDGGHSDVKMADEGAEDGSSSHNLEDSKGAVDITQPDDTDSRIGDTDDDEEDMKNCNNGDDDSMVSGTSSGSATVAEDVTRRDDGDDGDDDGSSHRADDHDLYSAARDAAESIGAAAAIGIEEGGADDNDSESAYENSDVSSDEYRDAVPDLPSSRRDELVPDELQTEEEKQREFARLEECSQQRKDIEKFAFLFERRLMELPLNKALKHYIKYLC